MNDKDPRRNQPTDNGRNNDPDLRDESAIQPGINTVSNSNYDEDNEELTKTAAGDFRRKNDFDPNADPSFDEIDQE
jgi:hypothetical protein